MGRGAVSVLSIVGVLLCAGTALAQDAQPQSSQPPGDQPQSGQPQGDQTPGTPPQSPARDPVASMVGAWEFSNADRDKICRFNFRSDAVPNGHKLDIDKNCPSLFASTKDIVAWALDNYGDLRLLDSGGNAVIDLTEVEGGMYDGFQPEQGRFVLQAAAAAPIRSADEMFGDWAVARGTGKPVCTLTLANNAASTDNLALKIKSGCDALITRFGPTSWHMDKGDLVLIAPRGEAWRFEENDANTWQRIPETADPILLIRQ